MPAALALLSLAAAESFEAGSAAVTLLADTELFIDVFSAGERIAWTGEGTLTVTSPLGGTTTLSSGNLLAADTGGIWSATLSQDEPPGWSLTAANDTGRVFSYLWHVDTGVGALDERFYVPVPMPGSFDPLSGSVQINKILAEGLYGSDISLAASRTGLEESPGYSSTDGSFDGLPIFLEYPDQFEESSTTGALSNVQVTYDLDCEQVVPGYGGVEVSFDAEVYGQPALICDLDEDGVPDISGFSDVALFGPATPGLSGVYWSGFGPLGDDLGQSGTFSCRVGLMGSPLHALVHGAGAADPGIRLFYSYDALTSYDISQVWNDFALEADTVTADLTLPLTATGPGGVTSGSVYAAGIMCTEATGTGCTAHGWGSASIRDLDHEDAWVDTWTIDEWMVGSDDLPLTLASLDDDDSDGLPTGVETCLTGTDPDEKDSDGDSLSDGDEVGGDWSAPPDHDDDGHIDALDEDDDNDGVLTATEVADTSDAGLPGDLDDDGAASWYDDDADGDGILDGDEPDDADGSGIPDYLEPAAGVGDSGTPTGGSLQGTFQGGVCRCTAAAPGAAGLWGMAMLMIALRRRRE